MKKDSKLPNIIPVFPLSNFIVFPNTTVPLNIFEPRYLKMTEDAMASNRLIGIIQPKKSGDLKKPDLFDVGCVCRIVSFNETDDGRYIIILKGLNRYKIIKEIDNKKLYREVSVDYNLFNEDQNSEDEDFEFSKIQKILEELKVLFKKRGYQINWKDLEKQNVYQTLSALSMASPFSIQEKQILLETKNLEERHIKFEEILNTYTTDFSNIKTIQ
ncbi:LON peptidase substrate-binding domain-containing protein [Candidatus Pelagibacter sp.]|nr:LON peptidase substrate-binding domain-containing protein [Candidatus Pelagibacter sp.]